MTILVTGANGLVGRRVVARLAADHEVLAVTRQPDPPLPDGVRHLRADLAAPAFSDLLPARADAVVHLAQSPRYREFPEGAGDVFDVNLGSTARLLEWAAGAGVSRFVLASAGGADRPSVAGRPSFYLATKHAAELLAACYADRLTVTVLRFHFVYGRGQRSSMLLPRLVAQVRDGRPLTLAGPDGMRLNPVHVDDAAAAAAQAAAAGVAGTFDVAGPEVVTMRALGEIIGHKVGRPPVFAVEADRAPDDLVGDIGPMARALWAPRIGLSTGLDDLVAPRTAGEPA